MAVQSAPIDTATNGDNIIVAAVTGKRIRVLGYVIVVNAAVACRWKSGASTNLSGALPFGSQGQGIAVPLSAPYVPAGGYPSYFETAAGQGLVLNLSGAVQVSGHVSYDVLV
jgi:hypothetical protein